MTEDATPPVLHPFTPAPGMTVPVPTTPLGFLQLFLSLELLQFMTEETNDYAQYVRHEMRQTRSYAWTPCTVAEMARYLGMVMMMGVVSFPNMKMYWRKSCPMYAPAFATAMSRPRFLAMSRYFHTFNRRAIPKNNEDKLIIVKPIMNYLLEKCRSLVIPERELSLDEGILPYKGHLSIKVYNPMKPHKYGLKFYFLCESLTGYVVDFIMYVAGRKSLRHTVYGLVGRFIGLYTLMERWPL